jgi:hypothetical protein
MLVEIFKNLTVENWARVCNILYKKWKETPESELFNKLSKLTSLEKSLTEDINKEIILKYKSIFPDLKKCPGFSQDLSVCPLYEFYLTMGDRFTYDNLKKVLNNDHFRKEHQYEFGILDKSGNLDQTIININVENQKEIIQFLLLLPVNQLFSRYSTFRFRFFFNFNYPIYI